jgi:poly(beta-D-mannuronate) C5 epimerase
MVFVSIFIFLLTPLSLLGASCYSILTEVDIKTAVSPLYELQMYQSNKCDVKATPYLFKSKNAFYGCYKKESVAKWVLKHSHFPFKNPKIIYHKVHRDDVYIVLPRDSYLNVKKEKKVLQKTYENITPKSILKKFPKHFYGDGIKIVPMHTISFVPESNIFSFYNQYKRKGYRDDVLMLYDGVYSLEMLYKRLHNDRYIQKRGKNRYVLKIPIIVSSTASLSIYDKTLYLQTKPKAVFVIYFGDMYLKNSIFYTWDTDEDIYAKREEISKQKLLYLGIQSPRPYFLGFSGSRSYFVNNIFKGLGFHSVVATFGISQASFPSKQYYYKSNRAFNYFLAQINKQPTGVYLGNDISKSTMAFYTNGAVDTVYLGNYTHDNIIYNFDPHDYSKHLVIARNLASKAGHAHGIIISRSVDHSIIAENLSIRNHSAGIMLDRLSNHNLIYKNIALLNGYMGISIQESNDVSILDNVVAFNGIDGVMIRNSLWVSVEKNRIFGNQKNGIEVISKNIDDTISRDFKRDPYAKASSATVFDNFLENNYNSNIMVKNSAGVYLEKNRNIGFAQNGGDLDFFQEDILRNSGKFRLYGRGFPFHALSTDNRVVNPVAFRVAKSIYQEIAKSSNDFVATDLAIVYLRQDKTSLAKKEFQRAANFLKSGALKYLGYLYLIDSMKNSHISKKKMIEGLTLIVEDTILQNPKYTEFEKLMFFLPKSQNIIEEAFENAIKRMQKGELFSRYFYKNSKVCRSSLRDKQSIKASLKIFLYKMKSVGVKTLLSYEKVLNRDFTIFTQHNLIKIKQDRFEDHNALQETIYAKNSLVKRQNRDILCQKYLQRHEYIKKQTEALVDEQYKKEIKKMLPKLQKYLDNINLYRKRKISMKELLKIIYTKGGK